MVTPDPLRTALSRGPASFSTLAGHFLEEYAAKIRRSVETLSEEQLWWRPGLQCNSVGNLLLHLHGNLSLWILKNLGAENFERDRDAEFSADRSRSGRELVDGLAGVVGRCRGVLGRLSDTDLACRIEVQGYETDGLGVVFHAVEHMSYHTGQIVWVAKQFVEGTQEIDFYRISG